MASFGVVSGSTHPMLTRPPSHSYSAEALKSLESVWCATTYSPLPVVLSKGQGVWLWDVEGKKYLDMTSAYSAVSHGHCHPDLVATLIHQAGRLALCSRAYYNDILPLFLQKLCLLTGFEKALPMNTGAEAVETALKAARRWGYRVKKIPPHKADIILMSQNFHGRTVGIISFSSQEEYREDFGPFLPGFKIIPFGDIDALEQAITPNTCAVITEPIQGEAGIIIPPAGWLKQVAELCKKNNCLLIADEVQSGLGRTGKILACDHEGVKPDGVILGKALGGGLLPVSALVGSKELLDVFTPGSHGSTFGGNPLAAAVGLKALCLLEEEKLAQNSAELGHYMISQLQSMKSPLVTEIRGKGLWVGLDIDPTHGSARSLCEKLMTLGVLCKETHETVVRLAPPLVITKQELDWGLERFWEVLKPQ